MVMDGRRFDEIARLIGTNASRRRVLKGIAGGIFGLSAAGLAARSVRAAGNFGDACATDDDCDAGQQLTCDESRSTCRGGPGFACFDTGDCSTEDSLLCRDSSGDECTGEETECGVCGGEEPACFTAGEECAVDADCCSGLVCADLVCAAPSSGSATVTIHKATCPTGVGPDIFNQCHGNVLGGVTFSVDGFEIGSGVITTDDSGVASKTILEAAASGGVTLTEDSAVFAQYLGAYVYCSEQGSGTVLIDGDAPNGSVSFTANQGDDIICDWYNLTEAAGGTTGGGTTTEPPATTLPSTGAGGERGHDSAWLGAAALGGTAAYLAARKLRGAPTGED
jgi:hypothetical protein